jgi:hypothetical protein
MRYAKSHFELLLISFIALFLELVIIRWLSTEIRIFAYFKNLPLMAAFLGFGIGCYFYRSADVLFYKWFPRLVGILVAIIALAPVLDLTRVILSIPGNTSCSARASAITPQFPRRLSSKQRRPIWLSFLFSS